MPNEHAGRIITFYSYKGGTGRSMALANVAWILASNGYRVLTVDWDLEAPGLHRYFGPFLIDPDLTATDGLIDIMVDFVSRAVSPDGACESNFEEWLTDRAGLLSEYTVSIDRGFPVSGLLHLLPSGRQGPGYGPRVNSFNWKDFYERVGGGLFINSIRDQMRRDYDFTLVDSRTGISDTSGICTVQMPDALALCFTYNVQSIEGAAAVAKSARAQRGDLWIYPVPCRVELAEMARLQQARDYARRRFEDLLPDPGEAERYWSDVETLYYPFYAYEEVLAVFADRQDTHLSLLASCERLASHLVGHAIRLAADSEMDRRNILDRFGSAIRRPRS